MRHRGFTLIEMLVTIGIIILLSGVLLVMLPRITRSANRTRLAADLQAIATALEQYKTDHGDYPRRTPGGAATTGTELLSWALIAPANTDGNTGPGFRLRGTQGRVYGPYLPADKFKVNTGIANGEILDYYSQPILYYPANPRKPDIYAINGYVAAVNTALYDSSYNTARLSEANLRAALGADATGKVPANQQPKFTGPFILWSAGPDGVFGSDVNNKTDDVTNFNQ